MKARTPCKPFAKASGTSLYRAPVIVSYAPWKGLYWLAWIHISGEELGRKGTIFFLLVAAEMKFFLLVDE